MKGISGKPADFLKITYSALLSICKLKQDTTFTYTCEVTHLKTPPTRRAEENVEEGAYYIDDAFFFPPAGILLCFIRVYILEAFPKVDIYYPV